MDIAFEDSVTANSEVLIRTFDDGESVLLNLDTENYFGLNDVGSRMWELLTTSESIEAAFAQLLQEYEVEPELLRADLKEFVAQLVDQGLVEIQANSGA